MQVRRASQAGPFPARRVGQVLTRQDDGRRVRLLKDRLPGGSRLGGVGRTHDRDVRNRTVGRQVLDRLVRGTILAHADGVVGPHVGDRKIHERGQAHGSAHEVGKHEERATVGPSQAVGGDAVEGGTHRELTDAEVQVTAELVAAEGRGGAVRGQE